MAAEREDAGRFIVHADEKLTALVELRSCDSRRPLRRRRDIVFKPAHIIRLLSHVSAAAATQTDEALRDAAADN